MDSERYERITRLFLKACELNPDERARFLDQACGDDAELRAEVESLLAHDRDDEDASPTVTREKTTLPEPPGGTPERIGPYRILRELGHGGMGIVYLAEQKEPIRRRVALKLIRAGLDTEQVVARFESERQALALLSHTNVARVFDAGTTEQGRPYVVMEYVDGPPITDWCDARRLSTTDRLNLFIEICRGVQHAHQKGIIHRDLKPSNVLVAVEGGRPVPKIIDFGLAKATGQRLTERTLFTQMGVVIGTPEYMSPEQADLDSDDIDTRTDVYSLGVLLYELLVGVRPFDLEDLRQGALNEILRRIREDEPSKPSTRLQSLGEASLEPARHRHSDPVSLARELRGELDWITMKALEKERTRRYGSPSDLARDIEGFLRHDPVEAGPPSAVYRLRRFVRRHRVGVTAAALVVAALVLGIAGTTIGFVRSVRAEQLARDEAERANLEATTATLVSDFLVGLFKVSDPSEARGNTITAREILDRGSDRIENDLADEPEVQARMMTTMGTVYLNLGLADQAEGLLTRALETHERILGLDHPLVAKDLEELAYSYFVYRGDFERSREYIERVLAIRRQALDPKHPDLATALAMAGGLCLQYGQRNSAEVFLREALQIQEEVLPPDDPELAYTLWVLGILHKHRGRYHDAWVTTERALRILESHESPPLWPVSVPDCLGRLGEIRRAQGRFDESASYLRRAVEISEKNLGADHKLVGEHLYELGCTLGMAGELDEAEAVIRRAVRLGWTERGAMLWDLVRLQCRQGDRSKADLEMQRFLDFARSSGVEGPRLLYWRAKYHALLGERGTALDLLAQAINHFHPGRFDQAQEFASVKGDPEFEALVRRSMELELVRKQRAAEGPEAGPGEKNAYARYLLAAEVGSLRDPHEALTFALQANKMTGNEKPDHLDTLAKAYYLTGDSAKAIETLQQALALLSKGSLSRPEFEQRLAEYEASQDGENEDTLQPN